MLANGLKYANGKMEEGIVKWVATLGVEVNGPIEWVMIAKDQRGDEHRLKHKDTFGKFEKW